MNLHLLELPTDVLIVIVQYFGISELAALYRTCKTFFTLIDTYGWCNYLRRNPRNSLSLSRAYETWSPARRVRYNTLTDRAWSNLRFVARPLSRPWKGRFQPTLALSKTRLVVASGCTIFCYKFNVIKSDSSQPSVQCEGSLSLSANPDSRRDITSIVSIHDEESCQTLLCGLQDGTFTQVVLLSQDDANMTGKVTHLGNISPMGGSIESLSCEGSLLLSLSSTGEASFRSPTSLEPALSSIQLGTRSWKSYLTTKASTPFAAFGTSSKTPLAVYSILYGTELPEKPTVILDTSKDTPSVSSAVYGICSAPLSSPWGSSPQIVVSGWFDGQVHVHDLRSPIRVSSSSLYSSDSTTHQIPRLHPVLSLSDPWTFDPIYSVSSGGGAGSHIAAGSARHSVVCFWDVRSPKNGWSVYAPGNDRSPVYDVVLESSRLFGATDSRPFVYDFGPGVTQDTYPAVKADGLKTKRSNPIAYYVTKYSHK
ncbi:hypothetical protein D9758_008705 [Tetrapyrgos nigripes]|uniref:F-box domain-containing protein n=1 Tax=Tetrapyrgos nigripes TaxID=182062 RepID=A0A8H5D3R9_9AGAR|nr:hypothetical protein D9758_008705 [Tetrapyrgos nigripes]